MATSLTLQKYPQEGDFTHSYSPLQNMLDENNEIVGFNTDEIEVDINNPLNIDCQASYDGTVNLLINDDSHPPRIINTRFSKLEDNRFKIINRNQIQQTNLYKKWNVDQQTRLFKNIEKFPKIDLTGVYNSGQLKGGNYTFYIKYADEDYNKTDYVAESGIVSVFKGQVDNIPSISGTLSDELTDKAITLKLSNLDRSYSKLYIYFTRDTSDTNGIRYTEAKMITEPYELKLDTESITITGYEELTDISIEDINIQYNIVTAAKTQAQVQNMLFLGNTQGVVLNLKELQNLSYFVKVTLQQTDDIGFVSPKDYSVGSKDDAQSEYYNPVNTYYRLGYWPDEIYRLGIVYIMIDDSLTPVFNLRGTEFGRVGDNNFKSNDKLTVTNSKGENETIYLERNAFLENGGWLDNTFGVFKNPTEDDNPIIGNDSVKPWYYEMNFSKDVLDELRKLGVKGYFIVRQKRIPTSLCQGFSVGIDAYSYTPMLFDGNKYFSESFVTSNGELNPGFSKRKVSTDRSACSGLLCLDAISIPTLRSSFDGSDFYLQTSKRAGYLRKDVKQERHYYLEENTSENSTRVASVVYVNSDTPLKYVNGYSYSTKCGTAEDVSQFSFFEKRVTGTDNLALLRGLYCPFLGISTKLQDNTVYTIKIPNYTRAYLKSYFKIRQNDNSPFFAVSDRYTIGTDAQTIDVYRGDCYTNTVTMRINRNFIDSEVPVNETIIDPSTWSDNYKGCNKMVNGVVDVPKDKGDYSAMNRADINAVPLGMWVTYKCLSNYNLGLRSINYLHTDEQALMGNPRSFYPVSDMTVNVSHKIEESYLLNQGYGATVGQRRAFAATNVPYTQELFDNRIFFSNVQAYGDFQNTYRIFQGLDYQDLERQYGAIVKLLPWNNNLLCIFEHGIGVIPVNEKALMATQSGQSIHMYGTGVLQNQITLISPDFGSIWQESIIRTPIGVYGVDTYAKKIWRVTLQGGIETISDMKVQRFLNDNIKLYEEDKYPTIGIKNVKTHYNNYKGDVMFTFYNDSKNTTWNLCFNERMNKWITRYSWTPLYSENIDNIFYSLDQKRTRVYSHIYNNINDNYGIRTSVHECNKDGLTSEITLAPYTKESFNVVTDTCNITIDSVETSYLGENGEEQTLLITDWDKDFPIAIENVPGDKKTSHPYGVLKIKDYNTVKNYFVSFFNNKAIKTLSDDPPVYYIINVNVETGTSGVISNFKETIGIVCDYKDQYEKLEDWTKLEDTFLRSGFYIHGKAGIFNEINYEDESFDNQILPTKWYNKQEPFEFEFVVNDQVGMHKIFNDLVIVSNNVQPKELEFEIEGDVFNFNKAGIFRDAKFGPKPDFSTGYIWDEKYNKPIKTTTPQGVEMTYQATQEFSNCRVEWDNNLNSYSLVVTQPCKNIYQHGRRLGNIQYKEDSWYTNIEPIIFKERFKIKNKTTNKGSEETQFMVGKEKSARIRDKYMKVRVKYTGQDLVVITALKTMLTMSYA